MLGDKVTRRYNRIEVTDDSMLIKYSTNIQKLSQEREYYYYIQNNLPEIAGYFPMIYGEGELGDEDYICLEYYDYLNLGQYMIASLKSPLEWERILKQLKQILIKFNKFVPDYEYNSVDAAYDMYVTKTIKEANNLMWDRPDLSKLFNSEHIVINGIKYQNFNTIWPVVLDFIKNNMLSFDPCLIHGDFCFSNILCSNGGNNMIKLIDMRGKFGEYAFHGDPRYDIAKLHHSINGGYEYIIHDMFNVTTTDDSITFYLDRKQHLEGIFHNVFFKDSDVNYKEILILEGCIYISMCARHNDSKKRQEVMYATGVRLLNEAMSL